MSQPLSAQSRGIKENPLCHKWQGSGRLAKDPLGFALTGCLAIKSILSEPHVLMSKLKRLH